MEYTMTPGELKVQKPELIVHSLSITQENAPSFVLPDNKWSKPFRYKFSCVCNGVYVEFEFEQEDRIEYGQYEWPQAVERWLIPHLAKRPNLEITGAGTASPLYAKLGAVGPGED